MSQQVTPFLPFDRSQQPPPPFVQHIPSGDLMLMSQQCLGSAYRKRCQRIRWPRLDLLILRVPLISLSRAPPDRHAAVFSPPRHLMSQHDKPFNIHRHGYISRETHTHTHTCAESSFPPPQENKSTSTVPNTGISD